jgi:hypothetical protein
VGVILRSRQLRESVSKSSGGFILEMLSVIDIDCVLILQIGNMQRNLQNYVEIAIHYGFVTMFAAAHQGGKWRPWLGSTAIWR